MEKFTENLQKLRKWIERKNITAYIVPHADEFQSEYLCDGMDRVYKLTGFKGSAGFAVITQFNALFFTDGRYVLQAKKQESYGYTVIDIAQHPYIAYLLEVLSSGSKIGYDPGLFTLSQITALKKGVESKSIKLVPIEENPVDEICGPVIFPLTELFVHPKSYTGLSSLEKRHAVVKKISADYLLITDPCSIAWLLNIRGRDIPNTPIFLSYAILHKNGHCDVFIKNPVERTSSVSKSLAKVTFYPLEKIKEALESLKGSCISLDPYQAPKKVVNNIVKEDIKKEKNPCLLLKACKNVQEQKGMQLCHRRDGLAMVEFLCWLDKQYLEKKHITEYDAAQKLDSFRKNKDLFLEPSFPTISAAGPNGAIIHYRVAKNSARALKAGDIYLVDSGGQYLDGTTDVTRTILFGRRASEEKKDFYTRVLKGHISIAKQYFPQYTTTGHALDTLARKYLWEVGCDFAHSTGHGVGYFSNVHEAPPSISRKGSDVLQEGMVVSNEPGYYREEAYGIRIESLLLVEKSVKKDFLQFLTLTLVPFDKRLIKKSLLSREELDWVNKYHENILNTFLPILKKNKKEQEVAWLKEATSCF